MSMSTDMSTDMKLHRQLRDFKGKENGRHASDQIIILPCMSVCVEVLLYKWGALNINVDKWMTTKVSNIIADTTSIPNSKSHITSDS